MEESIFPADVVRSKKVKFIEARLHSDTHFPEYQERIDGLIETVAKSIAQPIYIALDPKTEVEIGRFNGAVLTSPDPFAGFLGAMLEELN